MGSPGNVNDDPLAHRSAFAEPLYRRYFPASCFATLASWLIRFLFGWSAWELTLSAFWVGVVAGTMLLPTLLFSPLFGIVSDRINPRDGLLVTVLAHALVAVLAAVAAALNMLSLGSLVVLAILLGTATSAHTPLRLALVPRLVQRGALPSAIGYSAMIFNTSRIVGPAFGAWLVARFSVGVAFIVAGTLCIVAMLSLLGITVDSAAQRGPMAGFLTELRAGFSYALARRSIRLIMGLTLLNGALGRTLLELLPAFSGQLLDGSAETLATLSATAGIGSIIGGLFVSRLGGDQLRLVRLVVVCLAAAVACLFAVRWLGGLFQLGTMILALSMNTTIAGTATQALAQLTVDETYRGRVLSLWSMLAMGAPAIGAIAIGALAQSWGFPLVTAVTAGVATVLLVVLRPGTR